MLLRVSQSTQHEGVLAVGRVSEKARLMKRSSSLRSVVECRKRKSEMAMICSSRQPTSHGVFPAPDSLRQA